MTQRMWRDVRVVEGATLEMLCTARYRRFESSSLRHPYVKSRQKYFCRDFGFLSAASIEEWANCTALHLFSSAVGGGKQENLPCIFPHKLLLLRLFYRYHLLYNVGSHFLRCVRIVLCKGRDEVWGYRILLKKLLAAIRAAFPHTIPVLTGFLFFGMAYGILMSGRGFGWPWILLTSAVVFAGALQFVGISLLTSVFDPLYAFLIALSVNARHLIYGISMLEKYSGTGKVKPYLIFGMCDETFSILCSTQPPPNVDRRAFLFAVTLLNQVYWVLGSVAGGLIGPFLTFNMYGIDFVMTAFFVVIFLNQWRSQRKHASALIGLGASAVSLAIFGADTFIIPAMILIVACLTIFRTQLAKGVED